MFHSYEQNLCTQAEHINITEIQQKLNARVFGQHVAANAIVTSLEKWSAIENRQPLVLSLNGWTGIGKTYVSEILAESFPYVVEQVVSLHYPHSEDGELYADKLNKTFQTNLLPCSRRIIILDDVDKATWDIVTVLENILESVKSAQMPQLSILILLISGTGGPAINRATLEWVESGQSREDLSLAYMKSALLSQPDWHTDLYEAELIDELIPFLPLEEIHIKQCVAADLEQKHISRPDNAFIQDVVNDVIFFPKDRPLFSVSGCRKVTSLLACLTT